MLIATLSQVTLIITTVLGCDQLLSQ